jgi:CheY-like chemotaxis protein
VKSEGQGKGSEFIVRLPSVDSARLEPTCKPDLAPLDGLKVLLVEDNPDIRAVTRRLLESIQCTVYVAENGLKGIEEISAHHPDVALIDIGLPEIDGYEVARRIRSRPDLTNIKLIAVTGFGQPDDRKMALDAGFNAHLVKPVDLDELFKLLCQVSSRSC